MSSIPIEHNASCADYRPAYRCPACMRQAILAMEGTAVLLRAAIAKRDEYLKALIDDEPCHLDHEGYCQTHSLYRPCLVNAVRTELAAT